MIAGRVAAAGVAAIWLVVAARQLGIGDFADLALAAALSAIAVQVADLGVGIQLPQSFVDRGGPMPADAVRQALVRRLAGSVAAAPLLMAAFLVVARRPSPVVAAGFLVSVVATSVYGAVYIALRSADSYAVETVLEPAGRMMVLALGAYMLANGHGLAWIAWSYALADVVVLAIALVVLARKCGGARGGPPLNRVTWLIAAGPIGMVYWRADIWLLAALATSRQVALYGASYRLLDAALLPALIVAQLFPGPFARCSPEERRTFIVRWVRGAVAIVLPFAMGGILFARALLTLIYGRQFSGASPSLVLLSLAAPLTAAVFVLSTTLATLEPRAYIGIFVAALALNLAGNALLAPHFGASGAAAATVASQAILVCGEWAIVRRLLAPSDPQAARSHVR